MKNLQNKIKYELNEGTWNLNWSFVYSKTVNGGGKKMEKLILHQRHAMRNAKIEVYEAEEQQFWLDNMRLSTNYNYYSRVTPNAKCVMHPSRRGLVWDKKSLALSWTTFHENKLRVFTTYKLQSTVYGNTEQTGVSFWHMWATIATAACNGEELRS